MALAEAGGSASPVTATRCRVAATAALGSPARDHALEVIRAKGR